MGNTTLKVFSGIADAHGIESFHEVSKVGVCSPMISIRASSNRHRHALVYWVELNAHQEDIINRMLGNEDNPNRFKDALQLLHADDFVESVMVEQAMSKSWDMIPNSNLDPYR